MATATEPINKPPPINPAWLRDPALFAKHYLRCENWQTQNDILHSIQRNARTAVKACHASSKTFTAAQAVLWFLASHREAVVVTTAPTWTQVEKLLWGEIHAIARRAMYPFARDGKLIGTELHLGPKRYAYGLSTSVTKQNEGVKFQGVHADNVLVVMDEAPGIDPKIWEAIEGARAGGNVRVLAIGNPTIASGPFYDAFTSARTGWATFTISAFDTPNLAGLDIGTLEQLSEDELDNNPFPFLVTRRWVREKLTEWGTESPLFSARVLGAFPAQSEDALLSLAWLERASRSDLKPTFEISAGLDVAGPGEAETVLTVRAGPRILGIHAWAAPDPRGEIVRVLNQYRNPNDVKNRLVAVNVDTIGIGWGIYLHLSDLGFPAVPVNVSESPSDTERFANMKAELYWGLRLRLQPGDMAGLKDEKAIAQLASIRWKSNSRGQILIESKEDARKRGVKSPDRAESVMLAFADVPIERTEVFVHEEEIAIDPDLDEFERQHGIY